MKLLISALTLALFFVETTSLQAEDWKTINGKIYPQVKVIKVEADAVTILYRDGGAVLPLLLLPEDLQKRFHYDPVAARAAADARDKADFENARILRAEHSKALALKSSVVAAESASPAPNSPAPGASLHSTHHGTGELVDPTRTLWDDGSSATHYSTSEAAR